jgi:hydrogenase small subunit
LTVTPPTAFPQIAEQKGEGMTVGAAALASGVVGAALGGGAVLASRLGKPAPEGATSAKPSSRDKKSS